MKRLLPILIFTIVFNINNQKVTAQDVQFSNNLWSPSVTNPSLIGIRKDFTTVLQTRRQWASIADPYLYNQINLSYPLFYKPSNSKEAATTTFPWGSAGLSVVNGTSGTGGAYKVNDISGIFAYNIPLSSKHRITVSLQPELFNKSYSLTHLTSGNQWTGNGVDPSIANGERNVSYSKWNINLSSGLLWSKYSGSKIKYYSGIAFYNLLKETDNNGRSSIRFNYIGGITAYEDEDFIVSPKAQWMLQSKTNNIMLGSDFFYKLKNKNSLIKNGLVGVGVHYRVKDAIIVSAQLDQPSYVVGISYDVTTSSLDKNIQNANALELFLSFKVGVKRKPQKKQESRELSVSQDESEKNTFVKLYTFTQKDSTAINAKYTITEVDSKAGKELNSISIDDTLHLLKLEMPQKKQFEITVNLKGYIYYKFLLNTQNKDSITEYIYMIPIESGSLFTLNNVTFKKKKLELEASSFEVILDLIQVMRNYPDLKFEMTVYSFDKRSNRSNRKLSQKRVEAVRDFITSNGVESERIQIKEGDNLSNETIEEYKKSGNFRIDIKISQ